jgi:hypothetical protein
MGHLQMLGLLALVYRPWELMESTFVSGVDVTRYSFTWASSDCLFTEMSGEYRSMARVLATLLVPLLLMGVFQLMWLALGAYRVGHPSSSGRLPEEQGEGGGRWEGALKTMQQHGKLSSWQVLVYFYPSCISSILSVFSCKNLDVGAGTATYHRFLQAASLSGYWVEDYSMPCFTGQHLAFALAAGVLFLICYAFFLPGVNLLYLYQNHEKLHHPAFSMVNGVMYNSFRSRYYLWSGLTFARLFLLTAAPQLLLYFGSTTQLVAFILVLTVFTLVHLAYLPYRDRSTNLLHLLTLQAVLATAYAALVVDVQVARLGYVPPAVKSALNVLVIFINAGVIAALVLQIFVGAVDFVIQADPIGKAKAWLGRAKDGIGKLLQKPDGDGDDGDGDDNAHAA